MEAKPEYHFYSNPYTIGRKLYKYFSSEMYAIDCIKNRRIHLDDPESFNDPFDAAFRYPEFSMIPTSISDRIPLPQP